VVGPGGLTAREGRRFAFTVGAAFVVLGTISLWRGHHLPPRILWTLGGALLAAGAVIPSRLGGVYRSWMVLARAVSRVTGPVMLGAVYVFVVTPAGAVMRLLGRNPVRHREQNGGFWVPPSSGGRSDLETQF
jgi:hypothetical protein